MDPLEVLASVIKGPLGEVLAKLKALIAEASAGDPAAEALVAIVKSKLPPEVFDSLTAEAINSGVLGALRLFTDFKFGEPNPGAVALT